MGDGGDIAEPEHPAVAFDRRLRDRLDAIERAGDAQRHALRGGLDGAGRHDVVLLGQRIEQRLRRDAERRQLGVRELDEDPLVLGAVEIDLGDARHLQQPLAHAFGGLLQLRVVGAVAGHHVEDGIDVAEFVVDDGTEQTGRQLALHVGQLLAQQIKQIRHVLRRRRILEGDLHRGERRLRIGLHLVEIGQFLQLLLDRVGDLRLHFGGGRARPDRRDVHHLDREERILGAAELLIGEEAGGAERDDQEQDQRGMADRPARKIEALHRHSPRFELRRRHLIGRHCERSEAIQMLGRWIKCAHLLRRFAPRNDGTVDTQNDNDETTRTFWAGSSFCTPSATTLRALIDAAGDDDVVALVGFHGDRLQRDFALGIDDVERGIAAFAEQRRQRQPRHALGGGIGQRQRRGHAERDAVVGVGQRKFRQIGPRRGIGRRRDLAQLGGIFLVGLGPQRDGRHAVLGAAEQRFGDRDHGFLFGKARDADRGLPGRHDLAGLDQGRGDDAAGVGFQRRIGQRVLGEFDRALGAVEARARLVAGGLGLIQSARRWPSPWRANPWRAARRRRPAPARRWRRGIRPRPARPAVSDRLHRGSPAAGRHRRSGRLRPGVLRPCRGPESPCRSRSGA